MGIRSEFFNFAGNAISRGVAATNQWADDRADQRKMNDIDDRISKAAAGAKATGKNGNHALTPDLNGAPARDPKAIHFDPFDLVAAMGFRERPTGMTFSSMEMVGRGMPVVADVVQTRVKQIQMFCELPEDRYSSGFRVRKIDRTKSMTKKEEATARELEQIILHTGHYDLERPQDSVMLSAFCAQFMSDSLIFDQATFEVVPDRKGRPSYFTIVDPSTIRLIDPGVRSKGDPFAVQVINGAIAESFLEDELAFCIRNPRSGIRSFGYGTAEIETLVREITGLLWGMDYNRRFFSQGSATKGVLNFKGTIPDKHLQAFRRQWYSMVSGVSNAWRTPITNADELQWINMQMSNRDMEYSAWIDFLIKIVCARYNIATEEVNFSYGNTGQSQAMGSAPIEEKLQASKDLGLRPLIRWFFRMLNMHFLQRLAPEYEVIPWGMDEKGIEAETELLAKQTKFLITVNEARERAEMPPLPGDLGDVILDPTWLQYVQAKEAAEAEGAEGEEPEEEEEAPYEPEAANNDGYDEETGFAVSDSDGASPFDIRDDEAIKSQRNGRVLVKYTVDLDSPEQE